MSSVTGSENIPSGSRLCVCVCVCGGREGEGTVTTSPMGSCAVPNDAHNGRMRELYL